MDNRGQSSCAKNILTKDTILLAGTNNLGVHSHEVVVDGVLLLLLGFLYRESDSLDMSKMNKKNSDRLKRTGASMHFRN